MKSVVMVTDNKGWIKLHRELMDKAIWKCSTKEQKIILIVLLMLASHKENEWEWNGKKFTVKPGQFVTSAKSIMEKCGEGISRQNIRTALVKFEKYDFLTIQSTKQGILVTIVNWELYQSVEGELTKELTNSQPTGNQQVTTIKNDEKEKKDIYGDFSNVRLSRDEYEKLVNAYSEKTTKDFIEKLDAYIASTGRKYKNHYATILNWIRKEPNIKKVDQEKPVLSMDA